MKVINFKNGVLLLASCCLVLTMFLFLCNESVAAIDSWKLTTVYIKGDRVVHNGATWEAKWWNRGQQPGTTGKWGVWKEVEEVFETNVVGYTTSWYGTAEEIEYDKVSHLIYSFALPMNNGHLKPLANTTKLTKIVELAHAKGVKVLIGVGGWSDGPDVLDNRFVKLAATKEGRQNLINDTMNLVRTYKLDGVDIDWEWPDNPSKAANYEKLILELKQELVKEDKILASALVSGTPWLNTIADGLSKKAIDALDMINVMAYCADKNAPYEFAVSAFNYWKNRGVDTKKINLGVPFCSWNQAIPYKDIVAASPENAYKDYVKGMGYYDGIPTMKKKTNFVIDNKAGIMIWAIDHDTHNKLSLLRAINEEIERRK